MKFKRVLMVAGLSVWGWSVAATPAPSVDAGPKEPEKSIEAWVQDLSNEQYRVREAATRKVWEIGDDALPALQVAAGGNDPEAAFRANELIRKIELYLTPDTDPEVVKLVERYAKANTDEKQNLLGQMQRKRAWRQILKLYANEKNVELTRRIQRSIDEVAVIAARESLLKGKVEEAREFLEMAPADPVGLMALADFHRSQGTLEAELNRAKSLKGKNSDAWQLALYRASGNIEAARDAATAADESRISAGMSILLGDPVPWMKRSLVNREGEPVQRPYTELAIKRWQGANLRAKDLEPLNEALRSNSVTARRTAINSLFLLGEAQLAETAYTKASPGAAFAYYESLERIPEALKSFGLDPENPDYKTWVETRFERISRKKDDEEDPQDLSDTGELVMMANFMDRRGMGEAFRGAFLKPMAALAEKDERIFTSLLGMFFGNRLSLGGSPDMAKLIAFEWAGDDAGRWDDVMDAAFGEDEDAVRLWDWLAELDPAASRIDRFDGLLALNGMGTDPLRLRDKWLALGWQAIEKTAEDKRRPLFEKMATAIFMRSDVSNCLLLWDRFPKDDRDRFFRNSRISDLTIAGRWDEAATFFLDQLARIDKFKLDPSPSTHACAAACLRRAGRLKEAAIQDDWVEKLALGNDAYKIAIGYQFGDDFVRSSHWMRIAVIQDEPLTTGIYAYALEEHGEHLLEAGQWKEAAAIFEVKAQMAASLGTGTDSPVGILKLRLQADLARALAKLKDDRAGSLAILDKCYQMFPGDGTLADYFFPSVRKMGLIKEHDAWFKSSWDRMTAVIREFPGSSNTLNTTGWLAARAMRNLEEAEKFEKMALALKPDESAYLDTMAEIQFGKGNREKALEWSSRAVNFTPGGDMDSADGDFIESFMLRRQHEHFRLDPLPE